MTLHITYTSANFVLQISDRLVSLKKQASIVPFDETANKTLIYFARDGWVSIGYTGLAYIGHTPTDQWIAEKLIGEEVDSRRGPSGGIPIQISTGPAGRWFDIGMAKQVLRQELSHLPQLKRTSRSDWPRLFMAGWQSGKRYWRPVAHLIADTGTGAPYEDCPSAPRDGWLQGRFLLSFTPRGHELGSYANDLFEYLKQSTDAEEIERRMAAVLRFAADENSGIGKDYLAVLLPPPNTRRIRTRYVAFKENVATVHGYPNNPSPYIGPVGYSPWIVAPRFQAGPRVLIGSQSMHLQPGDFLLDMEGPSPPDGPSQISASQSQLRKEWSG